MSNTWEISSCKNKIYGLHKGHTQGTYTRVIHKVHTQGEAIYTKSIYSGCPQAIYIYGIHTGHTYRATYTESDVHKKQCVYR